MPIPVGGTSVEEEESSKTTSSRPVVQVITKEKP